MDPVTSWLTSLPIPIWGVWLLTGLLVLLLTKKSQVDEWAQEHPRIAGLMKTLRGIGLDPWIIAQGLCLIFLGRLPNWVQSAAEPVVKPPKPPVALMLVLALLLLRCSSAPVKPPCDEAKLGAIDAEYVEQVTFTCLPKYDRKEDCPEWPELKAKHRKRLREECSR